MTKFEDKQFKRNTIKFVIGVILLIMSGTYLQKHPAESVSVFSGFEVIFQKAEVFVQNIFGNNGESLEKKYSMQKYYKELIKMAENNKCLDVDVINEINESYQALKNEKLKDLIHVLPEYTKKAYEFDNIIKYDSC